jgi:hypothetical protein
VARSGGGERNFGDHVIWKGVMKSLITTWSGEERSFSGEKSERGGWVAGLRKGGEARLCLICICLHG